MYRIYGQGLPYRFHATQQHELHLAGAGRGRGCFSVAPIFGAAAMGSTAMGAKAALSWLTLLHGVFDVEVSVEADPSPTAITTPPPQSSTTT